MRTENKDKELNHRHFIGVRLTDVELNLLDQGAACFSISRSEYVRKLLLEKQIYHQVEVVADMNDLKKLVSEYGKIGSNLNQIARYFNTGGSRSLAVENEIHQCIADLFKLRKKVLKLAGGKNGNRKHIKAETQITQMPSTICCLSTMKKPGKRLLMNPAVASYEKNFIWMDLTVIRCLLIKNAN